MMNDEKGHAPENRHYLRDLDYETYGRVKREAQEAGFRDVYHDGERQRWYLDKAENENWFSAVNGLAKRLPQYFPGPTEKLLQEKEKTMENEPKPNGITVEIISQDGCPNCELAKEQLTKAGIRYVEIDYDNIASRPDRDDLMASLVISGVDINHPENVALPIMRVLSHDWSNSTKEILSQAREEAERFAAKNPEYTRVVEDVISGKVAKTFPPPNRVALPENKEWRTERIKMIQADAMAAAKAPGQGDPTEALDEMYLAMRNSVKGGGFSMGDFRQFVETAYKCMARQQAIVQEECLAQSTAKALGALFPKAKGQGGPERPGNQRGGMSL